MNTASATTYKCSIFNSSSTENKTLSVTPQKSPQLKKITIQQGKDNNYLIIPALELFIRLVDTNNNYNIDPITNETFYSLIKQNQEQSLPYVIACILDQNPNNYFTNYSFNYDTVIDGEAMQAKVEKTNFQHLRNPCTQKNIEKIDFYTTLSLEDPEYRFLYSHSQNYPDKNKAEFIKDFWLAMRGKEVRPKIKIAKAFYEGREVKKSLDLTLLFFKNAFTYGVIRSAYDLSQVLKTGTDHFPAETKLYENYLQTAAILGVPNSETELINQLYQKGRIEEAVNWLKVAVERNPNSENRILLSNIYLENKEFSLAKIQLEACKNDPKAIKPYFDLYFSPKSPFHDFSQGIQIIEQRLKSLTSNLESTTLVKEGLQQYLRTKKEEQEKHKQLLKSIENKKILLPQENKEPSQKQNYEEQVNLLADDLYQLAINYKKARGVNYSPTLYKQNLIEAAEKGHIEACLDLMRVHLRNINNSPEEEPFSHDQILSLHQRILQTAKSHQLEALINFYDCALTKVSKNSLQLGFLQLMRECVHAMEVSPRELSSALNKENYLGTYYLLLGKHYETGNYTEVDLNLAFEFYKKAADVDVCFSRPLANLCTNPKFEHANLFDYIQIYSYLCERPNASSEDIAKYQQIKRDRENFKLFKKLLKSKDQSLDRSFIKYQLGFCYLTGTGTIQSEEKGVTLIKEAAKEGYDLAINYLQEREINTADGKVRN